MAEPRASEVKHALSGRTEKLERPVVEMRARECLRDLKARRMNDLVLVATDGAPGLIRAVEEVFPQSLRQRCNLGWSET